MSEINEPENKIAELYRKEDLSKCTDHYLKTTGALSENEQTYIEALKHDLKTLKVALECYMGNDLKEDSNLSRSVKEALDDFEKTIDELEQLKIDYKRIEGAYINMLNKKYSSESPNVEDVLHNLP